MILCRHCNTVWMGNEMRYHNDGVLRTEQDLTLRLKLGAQKRKLTWVEYLPLVVLGALLLGLLMSGLLG